MTATNNRTNKTKRRSSKNKRSRKPSIESGPSITFKDSAAFDQARYSHTWLVESMLVNRQPAVIGGPKKAMKTSLLIDLAISLGSGDPFLGKFRVPQLRRVAVFSGESGAATIQETARRVCRSKGIALADCDVLWRFDLPKLNRKSSRQAIKEALKDHEVEVVFIDPLYLCLGGNVSASNLYEVGPVLRDTARACLSGGATPVLVHHAKKQQEQKDPKPLGLEELAFAGIGEFARQWLLLNRRQAYESGSGVHNLTLSAGGSAGHSAVWSLDIDEGVVGRDFQQRDWKVSVGSLGSSERREPRRSKRGLL